MRRDALPQAMVDGRAPDQEAEFQDDHDGRRLSGRDQPAFTGKPEQKEASEQAESGDNCQQRPSDGHSQTESHDRKQA